MALHLLQAAAGSSQSVPAELDVAVRQKLPADFENGLTSLTHG
jgi:hypothetical protein